MCCVVVVVVVVACVDENNCFSRVGNFSLFLFFVVWFDFEPNKRQDQPEVDSLSGTMGLHVACEANKDLVSHLKAQYSRLEPRSNMQFVLRRAIKYVTVMY